jgi:hypothetical protein
MSIKKMGFTLAIIGVFGALISALADFFGFGDDGVQAAQLLGIELGIIMALIGFGLVFVSGKRNIPLAHIINFNQFSLPDLSTFTWVFIGFVIVYVALFLRPVFLNSDRQMVYFYRYIPNTSLIGSDLRAVMQYVKGWLVLGESPYTGGYIAYPPLTLLLFAPLLLIGFPAYFYVITLATLTSYAVLTLVLPLALSQGKEKTAVFLLFVIGLFSYGLQFEIERGQFNLIAFAFCFSAIYLFHKYPAWRYFAYILFVVSVQLKIYPALFIFMFIDDWKNWKAILKRIFGLGLLNFLLLFVAGLGTFNEFLGATSQQQLLLTPWNGSSIRSFVFVLSRRGFGVFPENVINMVGENTRLIEMIFLIVFGICFFLLIFYALFKRVNGFNPYIFLACTIGALIVPTISNDYKLPLLIAPVSVLFVNWPDMDVVWKKVVSIAALLVVSIAFWSTFYPFKYKPEILQNSMPVLLLILVIATFINFIAPGTKINNAVET